jgi:hypothetical protein
MPEKLLDVVGNGVSLKNVTKRQIELWQEFSEEDEKSWKVFWKRVKNDMFINEIAERFGMSDNTVRKYHGELDSS